MLKHVYRAQIKQGQEKSLLSLLDDRTDLLSKYIQNDEIMTVSVYQWKQNVFTYYETICREISPDELFGDLSEQLERWPGQDDFRCWIPMMDIYHCREPVNPASGKEGSL